MPEDFYHRKKVLVTGHTGFKGAWLCQWLLSIGCDVSGFALAPAEPSHNLFSLLGLSKHMNSHIGDVRDLPAVQKAIDKSQPEIVFHLAAQALVLPSYEMPVDTFSTNIMGTVHVLEAARRIGSVKAIVNVTSDKCYENNESANAFRETDTLGGHDPYSASKAAAEIVSVAYRYSFLARANIAIATARAGNVIGGGDFADQRLIPDIMRTAQTGGTINLRHPVSIRPWQYVLDVLHGYLLLGQALYEKGDECAEAFNFAPDDICITAGELAAQFITALGKEITVTHTLESTAHETAVLMLDAEKARKILGWRSVMNTRRTIEHTAEWYRQYLLTPDAMGAFTTAQLERYRGMV